VPEDVPSLQRSSSFYYTEERIVAMETFKSILMRKVAQLPSDDFVMACVVTIIFLLTTVLALLLSLLAWLAK
jgi:hypothetical protein